MLCHCSLDTGYIDCSHPHNCGMLLEDFSGMVWYGPLVGRWKCSRWFLSGMMWTWGGVWMLGWSDVWYDLEFWWPWNAFLLWGGVVGLVFFFFLLSFEYWFVAQCEPTLITQRHRNCNKDRDVEKDLRDNTVGGEALILFNICFSSQFSCVLMYSDGRRAKPVFFCRNCSE